MELVCHYTPCLSLDYNGLGKMNWVLIHYELAFLFLCTCTFMRYFQNFRILDLWNFQDSQVEFFIHGFFHCNIWKLKWGWWFGTYKIIVRISALWYTALWWAKILTIISLFCGRNDVLIKSFLFLLTFRFIKGKFDVYLLWTFKKKLFPNFYHVLMLVTLREISCERNIPTKNIST